MSELSWNSVGDSSPSSSSTDRHRSGVEASSSANLGFVEEQVSAGVASVRLQAFSVSSSALQTDVVLH